MKEILQKQNSVSVSDKKAQVMSIDSSIAYLMFAVFLVYMAQYIVNISNPYSSYVTYEELYKNSEALSSEFITSEVSKTYLDNICETNYATVISSKASYEVKSLVMPGNDEIINNSQNGIHLKRENNELQILTNTNQIIRLDLIINSINEIIITESNTEVEDYYNKTINNDLTTISIYSDNSNSDTDNYSITINDNTLIFLNYYNTTVDNVYIGTTPMYYSCGEDRTLASKSLFSSYATLDETNLIAEYNVEVWYE